VKASLEEISQRGRGRPRDEEARTRILHSALEVLEELGFANTTTDAIADRAGASKSTIYRWWPNKAAVLLEALREAVAVELPFPDTGDLREDIRIQLRNFVKLLNAPRGRSLKAFITAAQNDPDVSEAFRSIWVRPRRDNATSRLERYRGTTMRTDIDLELVMDVIYGPIYYRLLIAHADLCEKYTDALADFVFAGMTSTA
jgi:AcrR family transcriptional regulator